MSILLKNTIIDNVLEKACQGEDWNKLLQDIYAGTKTELEQLIGKSNDDDVDSWGTQNVRMKRFSDLSLSEQATIIDRQYYNMQQNNSKSLSNLALMIGQTVDEELFKQIKSPNEINNINVDGPSEVSSPLKGTMKESPSETTLPIIHPSNLQSLLDISSKAIIYALETSPPELGTTTKLFVNRPIPISLRPYIWHRFIVASQYQTNTTPDVNISKVAGSLDVLLSRHIYSLLDTKFPEMSSRTTAGFIKDIISKFLKKFDIPIPQREEDCAVVDHIFFTIIPLLFVLSSLDSVKALRGTTNKINYGNDTFALVEIESKMSFIGSNKGTIRPFDLIYSSLCTILEVRFFGTISPSKRLMNSSPLLPRTLAILKEKNSALLGKLLHLRSSNLDKFTSFEDFLDQQLLSGLSNFLSLETCLFIWDQGFITEFSIMIPLSLACIVLGASKEIEHLNSVRNVVETLSSYCLNVSTFHLQKLLTTYCSSELLTVFVEEGSYQLAQNDDGLLQVLYQKLIPKSMVTKTNINNKTSPRPNTNNKSMKLAASKVKTANILSPRVNNGSIVPTGLNINQSPHNVNSNNNNNKALSNNLVNNYISGNSKNNNSNTPVTTTTTTASSNNSSNIPVNKTAVVQGPNVGNSDNNSSLNKPTGESDDNDNNNNNNNSQVNKSAGQPAGPNGVTVNDGSNSTTSDVGLFNQVGVITTTNVPMLPINKLEFKSNAEVEDENISKSKINKVEENTNKLPV